MADRGEGRSSTPADAHTLTSLRALIPSGPLTLRRALQAVDHQTAALNVAAGGSDIMDQLAHLKHITVVYDHLPVSSLSYWNGSTWIVILNARHARPRLRLSMAREVAAIIWHNHPVTTAEPNWLQHISDFFAHSLLIPAAGLQQAWDTGTRDLSELGERFTVTDDAMLTRLVQLRPWLPAHRRATRDWAHLIDRHPHHSRVLVDWIIDEQPEITGI